MENPAATPASAWRWIPSLYFAQGLPNVAMTSLAVVMFKNLNVSNADIAFYTSMPYLPWVIKPLWSPLVELVGKKRRWIVGLQFVLSVAFATVALTLPAADFFRYSLAVLWLMAFGSATHDIAADGFYLLALPPHEQAAFVGVRSTCFRLSILFGKGVLVALSGWLLGVTGSAAQAWGGIFLLLAALFLFAGIYHLRVLPHLAADGAMPPGVEGSNVGSDLGPTSRVRSAQAPTLHPQEQNTRTARPGDFWRVFATFFAKPGIGIAVAFLLLYRLAESLALKLVEAFLLDPRAKGGLGLTNGQLGLSYGGVGVAALLAGGLLGGWLISRHGLRRMLWPMLLVMHVPIAVFLLLAKVQPENLAVVSAGLAVEQFGYGFGFTAYMVYMMMIADGEHKTAHYAICTGFMALGLMLPGMAAGWLQEQLGYVGFFGWVCVATLPSFAATALIKVDPTFGKKV